MQAAFGLQPGKAESGDVDTPLLQTKLHAPRTRAGVVARRRLTDRLSVGVGSKLTLVSAPPGFGKSTSVGEWMAAHPSRAVAWLSLDAEDNDPTTFWTYVIAALRTAAPNVAERLVTAREPEQPGTEPGLRVLLNDLMSLTDDVVLVLDDYHVVERPEVHQAVGFVLDHLPPKVHLLVITRADPPLPLSRLRARGELLEIRAADLRFTPDEAAAYLNGTMGLALTGRDVAELESRTEGWIAALQLAALSMQGRDDVGSFIVSFAGDDRYLVDYLVDEVLARQSETTRGFLLQTAILDRFTGSLCDALTGRDDGKAVLEALDRANLFIVTLDDRRHWFRYHHLFADVLRARLFAERPAAIAGLHRRASDWFANNGERSEAIRHAMSAGDPERAADLMELALPDMRRARQEQSWRRWLDAMPLELFTARPVLSIIYVGVLMSAGDLERVDGLLEGAERWVAMPPEQRSGAGMVVVAAAEFDRLPSAIALYRTAQARIRGDIPATVEHARRAFELADEDDLIGRGSAAAFLGLAQWATGDLETAHRWYADGMASMERAGHLADVVAGAVTLADIRVGQGRLTAALSVLERGLALATASRPVLRGVPNMHVGISDILRERDDLAGATRHLEAAGNSGNESWFRQFPHRSRVVRARISQAEQDPAGALRLLDEAEAVYVGEFSPDVRPIAALRARVWISQGELSRASAWAREHNLSAGDPVTYLHEFEHATLARLLVAQGARAASDEPVRKAIELADRLVVAAQAGGRTGSLIDVLVVLAVAHRAAGEPGAAMQALGQAAALAEPEGHVRVFLDEGPAMAALLKEAARQPNAPDHVRRLHAGAREARGVFGAAQPLIEPLSERELEVLRLLGTELDGPGMARELVVSLSTVRTHTKNIYAKLGVNNRRSAVRRAEELELLSRTRP